MVRQETKSARKQSESAEGGTAKRGRKKKGAVTVSYPAPLVPLEESIHEHVVFVTITDST